MPRALIPSPGFMAYQAYNLPFFGVKMTERHGLSQL